MRNKNLMKSFHPTEAASNVVCASRDGNSFEDISARGDEPFNSLMVKQTQTVNSRFKGR
jgi:hypothetical protein